MEQNRGQKEIHTYVYGQLIFNTRVKTIQWEKESLFLRKEYFQRAYKKQTGRNEPVPYFTQYTKIHLQRIRDLSVKA